MKTIKNNIKELRVKKDIYQLKLAMDLELSQETISSYERFKIVPSTEVLIKLADYFNTSIDYLLCRTTYDLPIKDLKPRNMTDSQFLLCSKINSLSKKDQELVEAYITALIDKANT